MTLRSRRKPPTTAPNHTATATNVATGVAASGSVAELRLNVSTDTVPWDYASNRSQRAASALAVSLVFAVLCVTFVLPAKADETTAKFVKASGEITPAPNKSTVELKRISWASSRPTDPKATSVARPKSATAASLGWATKGSLGGKLKDTSTHLQWGARTLAVNAAKTASNSINQTRVARNEMPRRVASKRGTIRLNTAAKQREFGSTLLPPPAPTLSTVPQLKSPSGLVKGTSANSNNTSEKTATTKIAANSAAARLKAVASRLNDEKPLHPETPLLEPIKPLSLAAPVNQPAATVAKVAKPTPQLAVTPAVAKPALVASQPTGPKVPASKAVSKASQAKQANQSPLSLNPPAKQLAASKPAAKPKTTKPAAKASDVRQVQHTQDLRLPITNLRDRQVAPTTGKPGAIFNAPLPSTLPTDPTSRESRAADRFRFKDLTPLTKEVQSQGSRFDDVFGSLDEDKTDNNDFSFDDISDSDSTPQPNNAAPNEDLAPLPMDSDIASPLPDPVAPNSNVTPFAPPAVAPSGQASTADSLGEDVDDLKRQLEKELDQLKKLPDVDGQSFNPLDLDEDEESTPDSPLFSKDAPSAKRSPTGELAETNGRDCVAAAASCRKDLRYLLRRQRISNISLNISPSLTPAEVDMAKAEQTRVETMAKLSSQTWRNRAGTVIADGYLDDFRDDMVVIRTVNGSYRKVPLHKLDDKARCFVASHWEFPQECNFEGEQFKMRDFRMTTFTWVAASTCHKPLYFEQVGVERYGHSMGPIAQPIVSGAHFFGDILMLPYHAGINPANECMYTLGHYRPGECAPWLVPGFPVSESGFSWQGLALGAAISLMP